MKKILLSLFLLLTAVVSQAHDFEANGIYYNITSAEELTVEVTYRGNSMSDFPDRYTGNVEIPESVTFNDATYKVTKIGKNAFESCKGLTSVIIPNSVTEIGRVSFINCKGLSSVIIPNSVTRIDYAAFGNCSGLTSVIIPNSVTEIGASAFNGCSGLTFISIGSSVKTIGTAAFSKCSSLKSYYCFAEEVPNTNYSAFQGVDISSAVLHVPAVALEKYSSARSWEDFGQITAIVDTFSVDGIYYRVRLPDEFSVAVTYKGDSYLDYGERYSGSVVIPESVTYGGVTYRVAEIGEAAFYDCNGLTAVTIPESVETISKSAFSGCSGLTAVTIPRSVKEVGANAFYGCSFTSVHVPDSVTTIGSGAFSDCSGLESIVVEAGNPVYDSRNNCNAIMETSSNKLVQGCKNTVIPNETRAIGDGAFRGCSGLTAVTIPEDATEIGNEAFYNCSDLTFVSIGSWWLETIGASAFGNCKSLKDCYCFARNVPRTHSTAFCDVDMSSAILHVPAFFLEDYSSTAPWSDFGLITAIVDTFSVDDIYYRVTSIEKATVAVTYKGDSYFDYEERYSGSVVIPESVTYGGVTYRVAEIGEAAFYDCSGLTAVTIPDGVTEIGEGAFQYCTALTAITLPDGVTTIGDGAFSNCSGLTAVTIPDSVTTIGGAVFSGCSGLESIVVEAGNPVYDSRNNCNAIMETSSNKLVQGCKNTIIPNETTAIGDGAFRGCSGLTAVTIPDGVTTIGEGAFSHCTNLTAITIPDGVTTIGEGAFSHCTNLTAITIPDGVTEIADYTFWYCRYLDFVSIPSSVTAIGESAFDQCYYLSDIYCFAESVPNAKFDTFYRDLYRTTLHVPAASIQEYKNSASISMGPWSNFKNIIAMGSIGDTFIVDGICYEITSDKELTAAVARKNYIIYSGDIVIPESVTYSGQTYSVTAVGGGAFMNCYNLTSVSIPNSVTKIDYNAFNSCTGLTSFTIPNSVTCIEESAFSGSGLTSVSIPNSVTYIGKEAFFRCSGLTSVTIGQTSSSIPGSAIEIGIRAFSSCTALESVTFDNSMITIKGIAFSDCTGLTTATFGSNVTEINGESYVFYRCSGLKDFYCLAECVPTTDGVVIPNRSSLTLHVPAASLEAYRTTSPWSDFGRIVAIGEEDGIEQLPSGSLANQAVYDLNGRRTTTMQKGINLLRSADGRVKKVIRSKE